MKNTILLIILLFFANQSIVAQKIAKITYQYQDDTGFNCQGYLFINASEASFRIVDPRPNGLFQPENGAFEILFNLK